jgi:hypothetical protein
MYKTTFLPQVIFLDHLNIYIRHFGNKDVCFLGALVWEYCRISVRDCHQSLKKGLFLLFQSALITWCLLGTTFADKSTALVKREGKNVLSVD